MLNKPINDSSSKFKIPDITIYEPANTMIKWDLHSFRGNEVISVFKNNTQLSLDSFLTIDLLQNLDKEVLTKNDFDNDLLGASSSDPDFKIKLSIVPPNSNSENSTAAKALFVDFNLFAKTISSKTIYDKNQKKRFNKLELGLFLSQSLIDQILFGKLVVVEDLDNETQNYKFNLLGNFDINNISSVLEYFSSLKKNLTKNIKNNDTNRLEISEIVFENLSAFLTLKHKKINNITSDNQDENQLYEPNTKNFINLRRLAVKSNNTTNSTQAYKITFGLTDFIFIDNQNKYDDIDFSSVFTIDHHSTTLSSSSENINIGKFGENIFSILHEEFLNNSRFTSSTKLLIENKDFLILKPVLDFNY